MRRHVAHLACAFLAALATPSIGAQRTWTIGATQLQETVDLASPGDVLLVVGDASLVQVSIGKPLHIHGLGARLLANVIVEGIPLGGSFVLQGFEIRGGVRVRNCAGSVLLASLRDWPPPSYPGGLHVQVLIENSINVAIGSCSLHKSVVSATGSSLTVADSLIDGPQAGHLLVNAPGPAIAAADSVVRVAQSVLTGGTVVEPGYSFPAPPAIAMERTSLRVSGAMTALTAGSRTGFAARAIDGTGTVTLDPAATLIPFGGATAIAPAIPVTLRAHPTTSVVPASIGSVTTVTLRGRAGDAGALAFGFPALPVTTPGVLGELRLEGLTLVMLGQLDSSGSLGLSFPVPNAPILRAITFRWQGITSDGVSTIWAEPATECHR